jgi:hypothetical protein
MKKMYIIKGLVALMILAFPLTQIAGAEEVGQFTRIIQNVEHLKGGHGPAIKAKVKDKLANKDVVETHQDSKAQMKFIDDTIVTVAPKSKVTIDDYMYDNKKGTSKATMELLQGLVQTIVPAKKEPSFILKTKTAIMGIRG